MERPESTIDSKRMDLSSSSLLKSCPSCGAKLIFSQDAGVSRWVCMRCGFERRNWADPKGASMPEYVQNVEQPDDTEEERQSLEPISTTPSIPIRPSSSSTSLTYPKFCRYCGASLAEAKEQNAKFCSNCGGSIPLSEYTAPVNSMPENNPKILQQLPVTGKVYQKNENRYYSNPPNRMTTSSSPYRDPQMEYKGANSYEKRSSIVPLILGTAGSIFGIIAAVTTVLIGQFGIQFGIGHGLIVEASVAIAGSMIGMVGGVLNKKLGCILLIIGGIIVLVGVGFYGVFTFVIFLIGGILALRESW
jgi:DNA-directed RNA polymerase subunit M/transcription elongation factor TFIIS